MSSVERSPLHSPRNPPNEELSYLDNIIVKKIKGESLNCLQYIVDLFLRIFSCCYPSYDDRYQEMRAKLEDEVQPMQRVEIVTEVDVGCICIQCIVDVFFKLFPCCRSANDNSQKIPERLEDNTKETLQSNAPAIAEPAALEQPQITRMNQGGELHDFTPKKIAGLQLSTIARGRLTNEFITLGGIKCVLASAGFQGSCDWIEHCIVRQSTQAENIFTIEGWETDMKDNWALKMRNEWEVDINQRSTRIQDRIWNETLKRIEEPTEVVFFAKRKADNGPD